jgi:beta-glucosidase
MKFPEGFVWGTATAAHQVEGGNWNNDWWAWEHAPGTPCVEPSGDACDHFHRYPDDLDLLAGLGFGSYRFSVEWSRIEPEPGEFSVAALDHYTRMVAACLDRGLRPVVTLHHFTSPRWVAEAGGWTDAATAARFGVFAERTVAHIVGRLGDVVHRWCTINEPNVVATMGHLAGVFPPGRSDRAARHRANDVLVAAHRSAVEAVRAVSAAPVGLTLAMAAYEAMGDNEDELAQATARLERIRSGMEAPFLEAARDDDFFGVQTYTRERVGPRGVLGPAPGVPTTIMGYERWPQALEATIRRAWQETDATPIVVTENGIAAVDDADRLTFVHEALQGVLRCLADGIDVRGYTYWSLLDNFEWALGYGPTFGLIGVDRETLERTVRPTARWLGAVARANELFAADAALPDDETPDEGGVAS